MADPRKAPFRFWRFFFSLQGRVSRWPFLAFSLATRLTILAGYQGLRFVPGLNPVSMIAYTLPLSVLTLIVLWPNFALLFKRFHDSNLTGLWALLYFTPLFYALYESTVHLQQLTQHHAWAPMPNYVNWGLVAFNYALVLVVFLFPGSKTANRYGPPPGRLDDLAQDVFLAPE